MSFIAAMQPESTGVSGPHSPAAQGSANQPTASSALAAQIRSQWGAGHDWNVQGVDRADELASLLQARGINSLDQFSGAQVKPFEGRYGVTNDGSGWRTGAEWQAAAQQWDEQFAANPEAFSWGPQGDRAPRNPYRDVTPLSAGGTPNVLSYGNGQTLGFLGDYNNDGTFGSNSSEWLQDGNRLGWSSRGHGNVSYYARQNPQTGQMEIVPEWGTSSAAAEGREIATNAALIYGGGAMFGSAMAGAGVGAGAGAGAGVEGLSGMDLAADAVLGSGNNVMTAGGVLGGGTGAGAVSGMDLAADAAPGTGNNVVTAAGGNGAAAVAPNTNATNPALIDSATGTPGYGASSAGPGGGPGTLAGGGLSLPNNLGQLAQLGSLVGGVAGAVGASGGDSGTVTPGQAQTLAENPLPTLASLGVNAPGAESNPGVGQAQQAAAAIRDRQLGEADTNLANQRARIASVQGLTDSAVSGLQTSAARAGGVADMTLGDYVSGYRPVQQQLIERARTMDSQSAQDAAAGRAATDVQRNIDAALAGQRRSMASMGVNPGTMASPERADIIRMAAQRAGAGATARRNLVTDADNLRTTVSQMGQQTLGLSLNAGQTADAAHTGSVSVAQTPFNMERGGYADYLAGTNSAGNLNNQSAQIGLAGLGVNLDAYRTNQSATQQNNTNALDSWRLQQQSALDRAKLGETQREFDTDAALRNRSISAGIDQNRAAGIGSAVRFGVENWDNIGRIGSNLGTLFNYGGP